MKKEKYQFPTITVIPLSNELSMLNNHSVKYSTITVEGLEEDNEDTEIVLD